MWAEKRLSGTGASVAKRKLRLSQMLRVLVITFSCASFPSILQSKEL